MELGSEDWRDLARGHMNIAVPTKLRRILEYVGSRSACPGDPVEIAVASISRSLMLSRRMNSFSSCSI